MNNARDILGHVSVEVSVGRRKCHHSRGKHNILKDTTHLAVKSGPFGARKNYCAECAAPILKLAKARLEAMENKLDRVT